MRCLLPAMLGLVAAIPASAQARPQLSDTTRAYVAIDAPVVALTNVKLIDGTGAPPAGDQTVVIAEGRIWAVGAAGPAQRQRAAALPGQRGDHDPDHGQHLALLGALAEGARCRGPAAFAPAVAGRIDII
jgi:hypothetical protein